MNLNPDYIRNHEEIVAVLNTTMHDKFKPREGADTHESVIVGLRSRFKTFKSQDMSGEFLDLIFKDTKFDPFLRDSYAFIQIQKYDEGDFIAPHKDVYAIQKLHLVTLTTSETDGLIIEDGRGGLIRIFDKAGQYIDADNSLYHWVDPVSALRYSIVIAE